jgi:D-aspartate ligase
MSANVEAPPAKCSVTQDRVDSTNLESLRSDVPVVLIEGTLNNLGVVRSLSTAQMPIYVVATSRNCAAGWSRFCNFVQTPSLKSPALIDTLVALRRRLGTRAVLFAGGDQSVDTVSTHRNELEPLYRMNLPATEMVSALIDKTLFQNLAEREGFPVPRAVTISATSELQLLQSLIPPLVIKPGDKTLAINGIVERAVRAETLQEAETVVTRMLGGAPTVIVQEWIDGADSDIYFTLFSCDRQSNVIAMFTGRKLVCTPPRVGNTAICVAAPEAAGELQALALEFISRVEYRGLGSLEFKRNNRTGRFLIVEPTVGRTDWQEEIATLCGVNIPLLTYQAELGQPICIKKEIATSVAWRSSFEHRLPRAATTSGIRMVDGFFRWSDPLPAVYYYFIDRFAARILRRGKNYYRRLTMAQKRREDG